MAAVHAHAISRSDYFIKDLSFDPSFKTKLPKLTFRFNTIFDKCRNITAIEGERFLEQFQQNSKTIRTILTTSQKLSTGVDAKNVRKSVCGFSKTRCDIQRLRASCEKVCAVFRKNDAT
jgi:hypothetical protein